MTSITAAAHTLIEAALEKYAAQERFSYDTYWRRLVTAGGEAPCLHVVLVAPNPLLGQAPITADHPVTNPLDMAAQIDQVVKTGVTQVRAFQRQLIARQQ